MLHRRATQNVQERWKNSPRPLRFLSTTFIEKMMGARLIKTHHLSNLLLMEAPAI
jgi:hypothetical protein